MVKANFRWSGGSHRQSGFSLIEVLFAMIILATALIALSNTMQSSIRVQLRQQQQTFAFYVAQYRLGELRLEPEWPAEGITRGQIDMLNKQWQWRQTVSKTDEENLRRVEIAVSDPEDLDYAVASVTAFIGKPERAAQ